MKITDKTLLIHQDSKTNHTTSIIINEEDVVQKTQEFLAELSKTHKKVTVNAYSPLGVVLKAEDKQYSAVAYEKEKFVIVIPNGTESSAKLYGNWNEALVFAKRLLTPKNTQEKKSRIVLTQYLNEN